MWKHYDANGKIKRATVITNGTVDAGIKRLDNQVAATDYGLIVNSAIHGLTTAGGGGYVDVKVNPSGALTVEATPITLTKGTQGSTGYSTQDLKDAGRVAKRFYANAAASGTTGTETAITLTYSSGDSNVSTADSFTPTNGKTFRIQAMTFSNRGNNTATAAVTTFSLRLNTAGAVTTTSNPIYQVRVANQATANILNSIVVPIPDGMEIYGDGTKQWGVTANAVFVTNAPTWDVSIIGYEY